MSSIDWTEKCREELPTDSGYTDFPFESGDTMNSLVKRWNGEEDEVDEDNE